MTDLEALKARAAISAMRPTLSEDDRARVEEVRERHDYIQDVYGDTGLCPRSQRDRAFLLSLIDKLTEAKE